MGNYMSADQFELQEVIDESETKSKVLDPYLLENRGLVVPL